MTDIDSCSTVSAKSKNVTLDNLEVSKSAETKDYTTWSDIIKHWPKTTLCIVSSEFCERFSYYGMRTVMTFYLLNVLQFSVGQSTIFFNGFTVLCFTTPLLGSIIADGYIGKFWTIFSVSILYAIGQVILALASTQDYTSNLHPWLDFVGFLIIGLGTGGIKPCVAAFGGDQFELGQERMISLFFSMFYFSINAGGMISTFISPIFRSQPCLGQDSCYPLAFGVPAVLMVVATLVFMGGSFWYKKNPPKDNVIGEVSRLIIRACRNKWSSGSTPKEHWLCHYLTTHDCAFDSKCYELQTRTQNKSLCQKKKFIDDVRSLLRVLVMFLPVPMFWALYDQQGSVLLIQALQMDSRLSDSLLLLPDQMQTLNSVLILVFIPLFQVVIYPLASKFVELTPLRKMTAGGLLASFAFVITGFLQLQINTTLPKLPSPGESHISFWNQFNVPCTFDIIDGSHMRTLSQNMSLHDDKNDKSGTYASFVTEFVGKKDTASTWMKNYTIRYHADCPKGAKTTTISVTAVNQKIVYVGIGEFGSYQNVASTNKPTDGTGEFSMGIIAATDTVYAGNFAMCRQDADDFEKEHPCNPRSPADFYWWETNYNNGLDDRRANLTISEATGAQTATYYRHKSVKPGSWGLYYLLNTPKDVHRQTYSKYDTKVKDTNMRTRIHAQGGVYVFSLTGSQDAPVAHVLQVVQSNSVSILWQIPQIAVLTAAEILFSITGYEFAYSQSAPSMKSLVQALWLLTIAFGDAIIVIITILDLFQNMAIEFFVYAAAMAVVITIFALLGIFYYEYNYYTTDNNEECLITEDEDVEAAIDNQAFKEDDIGTTRF